MPSITAAINMSIKIRQAAAGDFLAIKRLIKMYPKNLMQQPLPKVSDFFVADFSGQIVGCCALQKYSTRLAELRSLAVEKKHQHQGIGGRLILACVKKAKKLKVYEVLTITGEVKLLSKFGFKLFNQEKFALFRVLG